MFKVPWNRKAGDLKQSSLIEKDTVTSMQYLLIYYVMFMENQMPEKEDLYF